ncbi:MAG: hypothetical protein COA52_01235 [Hyphomicrobiales bacterium]|nr:MAG: hypothetical protein COA52_00145 [Hyphomicrobiales bacterium]PCJ96857.1 MAG: hypothetical protein COA52_01235 [Hyphomicrobiales bacterium]
MSLHYIMDLHGKTVQQGYNLTLSFIKIHALSGKKTVKIITGRSGKMKKEFERWMSNPVFKPYIKEIHEDFHKGSFVIKLLPR